MAAFVFVHGSGQNAGCWSRVGDRLRAKGHTVAAPDLPKQAPEWGLEEYAAAIAESIPGPRAVVVGHSLSGVFLPLIPQAQECALLVFLAAVIPEPGKSVREQFAQDPGMFSPEWIAAGARWFDASQQESLSKEFLFHDCDEETLSWALGSVEPLNPGRLVTQPAPFARWPGVPAASIVAAHDKTLTPGWGRRASLRLLGKEAIEIQSGHCPHVSQPAMMADLLEQLAHGSLGHDR
ncbi:MAG TPA: alpha/beta hydrolase [Candidatus Polarisedimenticolia bacterium]|nr:alpha/beta hydrolase [Candidatus Polarisedimenticolia bacterium]